MDTNIDFNNCGSIGYVCPSNYTSCSAGACSSAPAVPLAYRVAIPGWDGSRTIDDDIYLFRFPFSVTMYNYSTTDITVTINGVSDCLTERKAQTQAKVELLRKPGCMIIQ